MTLFVVVEFVNDYEQGRILFQDEKSSGLCSTLCTGLKELCCGFEFRQVDLFTKWVWGG